MKNLHTCSCKEKTLESTGSFAEGSAPGTLICSLNWSEKHVVKAGDPQKGPPSLMLAICLSAPLNYWGGGGWAGGELES